MAVSALSAARAPPCVFNSMTSDVMSFPPIAARATPCSRPQPQAGRSLVVIQTIKSKKGNGETRDFLGNQGFRAVARIISCSARRAEHSEQTGTKL
jgi:hypothetical protein